MALSKEEREQFLAEVRIGALSVAEKPDRAPLTVPIWYQYTPGGDVWINTGAGSRKDKAIRAAGRFSLMVQRDEPTLRYVTVEGPVTEVRDGSYAQSLEMASRYLAPDAAKNFVEYEQANLGKHVVIVMRPEHWVSGDLGSL